LHKVLNQQSINSYALSKAEEEKDTEEMKVKVLLEEKQELKRKIANIDAQIKVSNDNLFFLQEYNINTLKGEAVLLARQENALSENEQVLNSLMLPKEWPWGCHLSPQAGRNFFQG
jgi:chromosome segregation ATPase